MHHQITNPPRILATLGTILLHMDYNTISECDYCKQTCDLELCTCRRCIINTGNELRQITVNGQTISIAPEEGGALTISADIPADKAAFFSDDFMEEPVVEVTDASTPY